RRPRRLRRLTRSTNPRPTKGSPERKLEAERPHAPSSSLHFAAEFTESTEKSRRVSTRRPRRARRKRKKRRPATEAQKHRGDTERRGKEGLKGVGIGWGLGRDR